MNKPTVTKNLTSLPFAPDMLEADELQRINEMAKPGHGYELHIEKGFVAWIPYGDPADHGPPADVSIQFDPARRFLEVEVPEWITVKTTKVSWA